MRRLTHEFLEAPPSYLHMPTLLPYVAPLSSVLYASAEEASSLAYAWAESGVRGYDELGSAFEVTTETCVACGRTC